jgi:hypothetical protein
VLVGRNVRSDADMRWQIRQTSPSPPHALLRNHGKRRYVDSSAQQVFFILFPIIFCNFLGIFLLALRAYAICMQSCVVQHGQGIK